jgi:beta-glucosidase
MAVGNLVIQGHAKDKRDAALRCIKAGLNMDMSCITYKEGVAGLVAEGALDETEIEELVRPILATKVEMGSFEHPYVDESLLEKVIAQTEHHQVSRWAAQCSIVLLKNEGGLLPLSKDLKNVAVIGPLADSKESTESCWMVFGHQPAAVTVLEGIQAKLPGAKVTYAHGPEIRRDIFSWFEGMMAGQTRKPAQTSQESEAAFQAAIETARAADQVVMVLGETDLMAGEAASRASLDLPGRQEELLQAVAALGKRVVLVLLNGRPLSVN